MGAESGRTDPPLIKVLFDEVYRFDFFQAVRLFERSFPERAPVGRYSPPLREAVRFRSRLSLEFPPSQLYQVDRSGADDGERPPEMTVAFMGLTGPLGVLPTHYTELVMERARYKDRALWEFLDIFNHRLISLFYRAWEKHRFPVAYERGEGDRFTEYLFHMIGMGTRGLRGRLGVPDQALLLYGGLIAQRPHSGDSIRAILSDYFEAPARIHQFAGQWLKLEEENLTRLGVANSELGTNAIAGTRVWDDQSKFRVQFGPLTFEKFSSFLPISPQFKQAAQLTRYLAGLEFDFDIQLTIKADQVFGCVLTTRAKRKPMLGWTTWLRTKPFTQDDSQVVLSVKD